MSQLQSDQARVMVGGLPIDPLTPGDAADRIVQAAREGSGASGCRQVATVNLQFLVSARHHGQVRDSLRSSWLSLADGAPVLWLSRIQGRRLPGRVTGVDLVEAVAARAALQGVPLLFFGGHDGVAEQAVQQLSRRHPGLRAQAYEPPLIVNGGEAERAAVEHINGTEAGILLVALSHPKGELLIAANRDRLRIPVAIGVGAGFDILTGRFQRAPGWAQASGLEWLFRLLQEPRRLFARYAQGALWLTVVLFPGALWQRLTSGSAAEPEVALPESRSSGTPGAVQPPQPRQTVTSRRRMWYRPLSGLGGSGGRRRP